MTVYPGAVFKEAVNEAIYRWKAKGVWTLVAGLWILAADTSQAALLSVMDAPRNAVVVGTTPTFTALKGFSGFDASHVVKFPITSAILASDSVYCVAAGHVNGSMPTAYFIDSDAGGSGIPGAFLFDSASGGMVRGAPANTPILSGISGVHAFVGGSSSSTMISPAGAGSTGGGSSGRSSNYKTAAIASHPLVRLSAYGFLGGTATTTQCFQFITILAEMLNEIGALD